MISWRFFLVLISVALLGAGCDILNADTSKVKMTPLQEFVRLQIDYSGAKWEVFSTPEYNGGGVPGPADESTLIAEVILNPVAIAAVEKFPIAGEYFIVPEASRVWLGAGFRKLLAKERNSTVNMGKYPGCHSISGDFRLDGKVRTGFICMNSTAALVYFPL